MMLLHAYGTANGKYLTDAERPLTAFGEHAYIWGAENIKGGFNCCTIQAEEWHTDISIFFMDWYGRTDLHHGDFYGNAKWVKMYDKICHGNIADLNEFEQEIAAGMIRKGYAVKQTTEYRPQCLCIQKNSTAKYLICKIRYGRDRQCFERYRNQSLLF